MMAKLFRKVFHDWKQIGVRRILSVRDIKREIKREEIEDERPRL